MSKEDDKGKQGFKTQLLENQLVAIVKCKRELEEEMGAEYVSGRHWKTHSCSQGHTMWLPRARAAWIQKELVPASLTPDPSPVPTTHSLNCPCPSCTGLGDSPSLAVQGACLAMVTGHSSQRKHKTGFGLQLMGKDSADFGPGSSQFLQEAS